MILLSSYDLFTLHIDNKERSLKKLGRLFKKIFYDARFWARKYNFQIIWLYQISQL